jgi:hypothetical protein
LSSGIRIEWEFCLALFTDGRTTTVLQELDILAVLGVDFGAMLHYRGRLRLLFEPRLSGNALLSDLDPGMTSSNQPLTTILSKIK